MKWLLENFVTSAGKDPAWYIWVGASLVFMWVFFWWSIGLAPVPALGGGFARAEQVSALSIQLIEPQLLDLRIRHCNAKESRTKQFFWSQIQKAQRRYRELTGTDYILPACSDLIDA